LRDQDHLARRARRGAGEAVEQVGAVEQKTGNAISELRLRVDIDEDNDLLQIVETQTNVGIFRGRF
jgi:hypothetical protein